LGIEIFIFLVQAAKCHPRRKKIKKASEKIRQMTHSITVIQMENHSLWDSYVHGHEKANPYHLRKWQQVITEAYGYKTYAPAKVPDKYLFAEQFQCILLRSA
jgi:hypothetical protein